MRRVVLCSLIFSAMVASAAPPAVADDLTTPIAERVAAGLREGQVYVDGSRQEDVSESLTEGVTSRWPSRPLVKQLQQGLPYLNLIILGSESSFVSESASRNDALLKGHELAQEIAEKVGRPGLYVIEDNQGVLSMWSTDPGLSADVSDIFNLLNNDSPSYGNAFIVTTDLLNDAKLISPCDFGLTGWKPMTIRWEDRQSPGLDRAMNIGNIEPSWYDSEIYLPRLLVDPDCKNHSMQVESRSGGPWRTVYRGPVGQKNFSIPYGKVCSGASCRGRFEFRVSIDGKRPETFSIDLKPSLSVDFQAPKAVQPGRMIPVTLTGDSGRPGACEFEVEVADIDGRKLDSYKRYLPLPTGTSPRSSSSFTIPTWAIGRVGIRANCLTGKQSWSKFLQVMVTTGA